MRIVRILLQIIIVFAGVSALAALIGTNADWGKVALMTCFIAFLLAMTFSLNEYTESRTQFRPPSPKYIAIVLMLLGGFGVFLGMSYFTGSEPLPNGSGRCNAVCGLILLAVELFDESVARLLAGLFWSCSGILLCYFGYILKTAR